MASWIAGLFFLRFWRETRDRLFAIFAVAFWLLGITRIALATTQNSSAETHSNIYILRLIAFLLILAAIADKNRPWRLRRSGPDSQS